MRTVVITGSARGFGFEMLKCFKKQNYNVVVCDINKNALKDATKELEQIKGRGKVISVCADITVEKDITDLLSKIKKETKTIDIWINNAGVNQLMVPIWKLDTDTVNRLLDIDLKGTILCSKVVNAFMIKQGYGQIYNVEGMGSNDAKQFGLSIYGTAKRAVTYFTESLAFENNKEQTGVIVGKITPGIMITNFINHSLGDKEEFKLDEKTKKVYNILGDYPDVIAKYMVDKIVRNEKQNPKFVWLTSWRAAWRFMTFKFKKRDFFEEK